MRRRNSLPLLLCLAASSEAPPRAERRLAAHSYQEVALTAADAAADDRFGWSVAIDGDTVVVGAYYKDGQTGAAYVFRTSDGGAAYGQVVKLTASDAAGGDWFGYPVAVANGTIVVGAIGAGTGGAAYVFRTSTCVSPETDGECRAAVLAAGLSEGGCNHGFAGDYGAGRGCYTYEAGHTCAGSGFWSTSGDPTGDPGGDRVRVCSAEGPSDGGATYNQVAKLTAADVATGDWFGRSVALDGGTIVVGADDDDDGGTDSGSAYIFRTDDGGTTYGQVAKLTASDAAAVDGFGWAVAIDGDTVVVGAWRDADAGTDSGSAYVFRTTDGGATYGQVAKLTAADAASYDFFGCSVAIDGNTVVVGTFNKEAVYVFRTSHGGATYGQVAKLTASDAVAGDQFGRSVAIDGNTIVIGSRGDDDAGTDSGSAYAFRTTDGWDTHTEIKLTASDAAANDFLGMSVATDGDSVAVGAYYKDDQTGAAYVFTLPALPSSQPTVSPAPSPLPSPAPTTTPTPRPTTAMPTVTPGDPTRSPIPDPTLSPSPLPTPRPSPQPSPVPSPRPTPVPSPQPTSRPTPAPAPSRRGIGLALTVVVCVVASFVVIFVVSGCFGRHIVAAAPEPGTEKPPTPGNQANKLHEVHNEMARWYQAPQQAALHQTFGPFPPPDRFEAWPGFVPVTNAFMDAKDRTASTERVPSAPPLPQEPPAEEEGWATRGLRRVMSWRATVRDMMLEQD
jgi:hypothetical protein